MIRNEDSCEHGSVDDKKDGESETCDSSFIISGAEMKGGDSNRTYKQWRVEHDQSMNELLNHMREECDEYFKRIKPNAIKYFYMDYCTKTDQRLDKLMNRFSKRLELMKKEKQQLEIQITATKKKVRDLQKKKSEIQDAKEQMLRSYEVGFTNNRFQDI